MRGGIASKLTVNNDMVARLKGCSGDLRVRQQARGAPLESPALRRSVFAHDIYLHEGMGIAPGKLRHNALDFRFLRPVVLCSERVMRESTVEAPAMRMIAPSMRILRFMTRLP